MVEKGRCQWIREHRCKKGRVYKIEISPGIVISVCPQHKRLSMRQFNAVAVEEPEEQQSNVVPITGGKTGGKSPWLSNLPVGCLFIASSKKSFTTCLDEYRIMGREEANGESYTLLRQNRRQDNKDHSDWEWHDDELFSHENKLKKVLHG